MAEAQPGTRNATLNRAAFKLGTLCAAGRVDRGQLVDVLLDTARHGGLPEREAEAAIRSGLTAGERRPRTYTGRAA
ncbi:hypothetical protein [Streptomyces sp. NPDC059828]|uniref:hypothetical protein n=1 Tax=Streptomyces sp. NPDC059828 TaxID=3346965 RepID=UPI00365858EE